MKKLLKELFEADHSLHYRIIIDNSKILADIFDEKNKEICSTCPRIQTRDLKYGCCSDCGHSNGYFRNLYDNIVSNLFLNKMKKKFNFDKKKFGFFNSEKMICSLPREIRSYTCLNYICGDMKLTGDQVDKVRISSKIIQLAKMDLNLPY
jgi:hypothetical protein